MRNVLDTQLYSQSNLAVQQNSMWTFTPNVSFFMTLLSEKQTKLFSDCYWSPKWNQCHPFQRTPGSLSMVIISSEIRDLVSEVNIWCCVRSLCFSYSETFSVWHFGCLWWVWVSSPLKKKLNRRDEHLWQYQEIISCLMRKWKQWQHKSYSWQMDWTKCNWLQCFQTGFPFVAFKCSEMRLMLTG